ncbi:MAG: hypothetical protein QOH48_1625 [Actinomycetota bacterium]|nr:hypothetical protein [Actinomycetota bacterium]
MVREASFIRTWGCANADSLSRAELGSFFSSPHRMATHVAILRTGSPIDDVVETGVQGRPPVQGRRAGRNLPEGRKSQPDPHGTDCAAGPPSRRKRTGAGRLLRRSCSSAVAPLLLRALHAQGTNPGRTGAGEPVGILSSGLEPEVARIRWCGKA